MNFFDSEFARYARSTYKRRRGWWTLAAVVTGWAVFVVLGYGAYILVTHVI
jgi:hypothetical protein